MAGLVPATHGRQALAWIPSTPKQPSTSWSRKHGTLYIGVTGSLIQRISEHREGSRGGFTSRYHVTRLVWFERHDGIVTAIRREKSLKKYPRQWKINLIERENPNWDDLFSALL